MRPFVLALPILVLLAGCADSPEGDASPDPGVLVAEDPVMPEEQAGAGGAQALTTTIPVDVEGPAQTVACVPVQLGCAGVQQNAGIRREVKAEGTVLGGTLEASVSDPTGAEYTLQVVAELPGRDDVAILGQVTGVMPLSVEIAPSPGPVDRLLVSVDPSKAGPATAATNDGWRVTGEVVMQA